MAETKNILMEWEAPEYKIYEKPKLWYLGYFTLIIFLLYLALLENDYFGMFAICIIAFLVWFFTTREPRHISIKIADKSIIVGELVLPITQIKHFWVLNNSRHKAVNLETSATFGRLVTLELGETDPDQVKQVLSGILPEAPNSDETFTQRIRFHLRI